LLRWREVDNLVANRDATARRATLLAEHAERKVLDGKVRMTFGRRHPARKFRRVCFVESWRDLSILLFDNENAADL